MHEVTIRRVDYGYFVRPADETGTGAPRVEPCLGYVIDHTDGVLLFDTGMGRDPEVDVRYRPRLHAFCPITNAFNVCHAGSFCDSNCWPPP